MAGHGCLRLSSSLGPGPCLEAGSFCCFAFTLELCHLDLKHCIGELWDSAVTSFCVVGITWLTS